MSSTPERARAVYRGLLRWGSRFPQDNFRDYAVRRTRERFRHHRTEKDPARVNEFLREAEEQLSLVKRQVAISNLYPGEKTLVDSRR